VKCLIVVIGKTLEFEGKYSLAFAIVEALNLSNIEQNYPVWIYQGSDEIGFAKNGGLSVTYKEKQ
jgi:hypothetical protein